jgi:hypothetical protein
VTGRVRRRRFFRIGRRTLIVVLALVAAFCLATALLLVWPAQGGPARVDAIVMLAGADARHLDGP